MELGCKARCVRKICRFAGRELALILAFSPEEKGGVVEAHRLIDALLESPACLYSTART